MDKQPFFSVLIPTRNRHEILKLSLFSLLNQSFKDFEVIISDNSEPEIQNKNAQYIQNLRAHNVKYVRPPQVLTMHDNWEFALKSANGLYKGVLIDKTLFKKNALL